MNFILLALTVTFGPYHAGYISNYDGDTVTLSIVIWPELITQQAVRVKFIDTPEMRGGCPEEKRLARKAKDRGRELMENAQRMMVTVYGLDKYGRPLVTIDVDGVDYGEAMISGNLARRYDGGTRQPWC